MINKTKNSEEDIDKQLIEFVKRDIELSRSLFAFVLE